MRARTSIARLGLNPPGQADIMVDEKIADDNGQKRERADDDEPDTLHQSLLAYKRYSAATGKVKEIEERLRSEASNTGAKRQLHLEDAEAAAEACEKDYKSKCAEFRECLLKNDFTVEEFIRLARSL